MGLLHVLGIIVVGLIMAFALVNIFNTTQSSLGTAINNTSAFGGVTESIYQTTSLMGFAIALLPIALVIGGVMMAMDIFSTGGFNLFGRNTTTTIVRRGDGTVEIHSGDQRTVFRDGFLQPVSGATVNIAEILGTQTQSQRTGACEKCGSVGELFACHTGGVRKDLCEECLYR